MSIRIDEQNRIFTLHTARSTYQMCADSRGVLRHIYYGPRAEGDACYLYVPHDRGFSMQPPGDGDDREYSLDSIPLEYPAFGCGDTRSAAFSMMNPDGSVAADLRFSRWETRKGKYTLPGLPHVHEEDPDAFPGFSCHSGQKEETYIAEACGSPSEREEPNLSPYLMEGDSLSLRIVLTDRVSGVEVELLYGVIESLDIITRAVQVVNRGKGTVVLKKVLSASIDFVHGRYDWTTFYGRHAMERNVQREEIRHGVRKVGSRRGASSHQYNPLTIAAEYGASETAGMCYAMELVWSGGFVSCAEKDQYDATRWQMGLMDENFSWPLPSGDSFTAPEVILTFSAQGYEQLSINLHDCIRRHIVRGPWKDRIRPLLLNSWEGCYFDFDGKRILALAEQAKSLGLDMIVMDDGWFGKRDDDSSGLGDWHANEEKLGGTLPGLIRSVHETGLLFGIWIEPEMVSEDSDLYRAHPDYAIKIPGRDPVRGRNQLVLDFTRAEIVEHVFRQLCETFREEAPDYIKWDFNRSLHEAFSPSVQDQGMVFYRYMLGVYDLLERVRTRWPDLLIEGCAGGGGRFDAGMLYFTPQIWCSDNTDAIDRIRIQYGTSFGYPSSAVGAHVSVSPNEQNGRVTPLATRAATAMTGAFGYELDPEHMTEEEKEAIRAQVRLFRQLSPLVLSGDYLRLTDPFNDHVGAWEIAAKDASEALVTAVTLEIHGNAPQNYIRLRRLTPGAFYRNTFDDKVYPADMLMHAGLPVPRTLTEYDAHLWHFVRE